MGKWITFGSIGIIILFVLNHSDLTLFFGHTDAPLMEKLRDPALRADFEKIVKMEEIKKVAEAAPASRDPASLSAAPLQPAQAIAQWDKIVETQQGLKDLTENLKNTVHCSGNTALLCIEIISVMNFQNGTPPELTEIQKSADAELLNHSIDYIEAINIALQNNTLPPEAIESMKLIRKTLKINLGASEEDAAN